MADMGLITKKLRVLMNVQEKPVRVVEQSARRDAMSAVVGPGDTVEWTCNKNAIFTIAFVAGTPFADWTGSSKSSVNGKVAGTIEASPADVVFKYDVEGPGGTLDPEIIIET